MLPLRQLEKLLHQLSHFYFGVYYYFPPGGMGREGREALCFWRRWVNCEGGWV